MGKRITAEEIAQIEKLNSKGKTATEISEELGLAKSQVYNQLKKFKQAPDTEQEEDHEEAEEEGVDYEYWANFWKQKYLDLHADYVMDEHLKE